jgi:short-subunit dehydrogenase
MGKRRNLAGSRILVTGASQGIGKALAEAAAGRGARVLACARKIELLHDLAEQIRAKGGVIEIAQADITSREDRRRLVESAERAFGGLDILINNAGIGATGHFADAGADRLRQIMEVNFFGLTETTRAFLPMLKKGNKPAIVNISSIAGKRAIPARSEYSASKFAVQGFSEALRAELAKDGVDVLVVCPGLTQTNFSSNMIEQKALMQLDHMRGMSAGDVAQQTLRAVEKGYNETCLTLQGKLMVLVSRFFPWIADIVVKKKVRDLFKDEIPAGRNAMCREGEAAGGPEPPGAGAGGPTPSRLKVPARQEPRPPRPPG